MRRGTGLKFALLATALLLAGLGWGGEYSARPVATDMAAPAANPSPGSQPRSPGVVVRVSTKEKIVALTFDDGPDPRYTPALLEIARANDVKLTFFLVGEKVHAYPELAKREVAEGHAVGNHTWDHHIMVELSRRQDQSEIQRCEDELDQISPDRPHLFRPPKGLWDDDTYRAATGLGYPLVLWSVELEHHPRHSAQQLARRAVGLVRPGAIILAHDGEVDQTVDRTKTLEALPLLIAGLKQKGYRFVTVPELLALGKPVGGQAPGTP